MLCLSPCPNYRPGALEEGSWWPNKNGRKSPRLAQHCPSPDNYGGWSIEYRKPVRRCVFVAFPSDCDCDHWFCENKKVKSPWPKIKRLQNCCVSNQDMELILKSQLLPSVFKIWELESRSPLEIQQERKGNTACCWIATELTCDPRTSCAFEVTGLKFWPPASQLLSFSTFFSYFSSP